MSLQCESRAALLCFLAVAVVMLTARNRAMTPWCIWPILALLALWGCMKQFVGRRQWWTGVFSRNVCCEISRLRLGMWEISLSSSPSLRISQIPLSRNGWVIPCTEAWVLSVRLLYIQVSSDALCFSSFTFVSGVSPLFQVLCSFCKTITPFLPVSSARCF